MKILLLGAAGFIGTNLTIELAKKTEDEITLVDRSKAFFKPIVSMDLKNVHILEADLTVDMDFDSILKDQEVVYHLVSTTVPTTSNQHISQELVSNVIFSANLFEACIRCGVKKVVFVSSGGTVYGKEVDCPLKEKTATNPISSYGVQKITIEKLLYLYRYMYGLDYRIIRLANPYGPYQRPNGVLGAVTTFTYKALKGDEITVYGDGSVVRDFIYIDDAIRAIMKIVNGENQPCVLEAAGFCTEHSANARSIGYEEERSPTLRAGVVPAAIALENHPADSRVKISEDGKVQTLTSRCGTGGGNVPMVMDAVENPVESPVKDIENSPAITLKIRSGCEGGGKGAIWQEEKSATLGCNNDQTLFVPKCYGVCSKASHSMMSDNPHSGFYEAETSRTLDRSGGDPTCNQGGICVVEPVAFTQNQRDEVRDLGEKSAALAAEPGMKQQTFVAQPEEVTAFHVNQRNELIELHGKSGALMATRSDQMQTFVLQGNMIGRKDENGPQGDGVNEDVCFTLDATDRHAVCAPEDVYAMTTGSYMQVAKEVAPTLMARDYKDPTTIAPAPHLNEGVAGTVATGAHPSGFNGQDAFNDRLVIDNPEAQPVPVTYTVRRLTPTECARLQGFPDWWCRDLGTENPTEEELAFWADVFETHRKIVTHAKKPKTEKQIRKWLADPYTDSAEYRIWGNGICLANAFFVLAGIAWCAGLEE